MGFSLHRFAGTDPDGVGAYANLIAARDGRLELFEAQFDGLIRTGDDAHRFAFPCEGICWAYGDGRLGGPDVGLGFRS